jgi:hypothetical protein
VPSNRLQRFTGARPGRRPSLAGLASLLLGQLLVPSGCYRDPPPRNFGQGGGTAGSLGGGGGADVATGSGGRAETEPGGGASGSGVGGGPGGAGDASGTDGSGPAGAGGGVGTAGSSDCPPATGGAALPFVEGFESYAAGPLMTATGSPWVRANQGRAGNVSTSWVHAGVHDLEIYSFSTATELHYVPLAFPSPIARVDVELWYAPDGYFVYEDFASVGLGCARSKFDLQPALTIAGSDHDLTLDPAAAKVTLFNEVDYGSSAFPDTEPAAVIHNYVRFEIDLAMGQLRTFVGPDAGAPLRSTVPIPAALGFNAFFVAGGLNPTYIDDISITTR